MTEDEPLKAECDTWLSTNGAAKRMDSALYRFQINALMSLCKRHQAVGLREAADYVRERTTGNAIFDDEHHATIAWCEAKAKEREG